MKRIMMVVVLLIGILFISGCSSNPKPITYTKFIETFKDKDGFLTENQTLKYEDKFERCIESSTDDVTFLYYEFKSEEKARAYLEDNYKGRKKYRYSDNKKRIIVKCTDKMYFYAVQVDKSVVIGHTSNKKFKKVIKDIFKELGY